MIITLEDMVSSLMIKFSKMSINIKDLYDYYILLENKFKNKSKNNIILYSNEYIKDFLKLNNEFGFNKGVIFLKKDFNLNYLQEHFISFMDIEKLEYLDLLTEDSLDLIK